MEDPMTRFASTISARRTVVSALTALFVAAAVPSAALADNSDGTWKVDPAKSAIASGSATLSITRASNATPGAGTFIVVSKGNVYLVAGATASDSKGVQPVDYGHMAAQGKAVLIGRNARSTDLCGFRCQGGLPESHISLSFRTVKGAEQQINEMLAQGN
jgi:hypothetical protein